MRTTISEDHPSPLKSPIWAQLGTLHQNLIVLPAWQCAKTASPGGIEGYRFFGFLAIQNHMRINSYQSARYTGVAQDYHCEEAPAELATRPLSPDSAYVVTPELAEAIARGPTGPGKCHDLDNLILCSTKTDFGLSPVLMTAEQRLEQRGRQSRDWKTVTSLHGRTTVSQRSVTATHAHSGTYSLAENGVGTVYQDINGLQPGGIYTLSAWVSCSSLNQHATEDLQSHGQHGNVVAADSVRFRMAGGVALIYRGRRRRGAHSSGARPGRRHRVLGRHSYLFREGRSLK